jgi:hypothetical protein
MSVIFACNDELGIFEGCARTVEFENCIRLDAVSLTRPPRLAFIEFEGLVRMVRISGKLFPVLKHRNYLGNACKAQVLMEPAVATAMLNFLKSKGAFANAAGSIQHLRAWEFEERFTVSSLESAVKEAYQG